MHLIFRTGILVALFWYSGNTGVQAQIQKIDITQFGALGDGITLNTTFIQNAIDQCHATGGGEVIIPKGLFVSGSIYLKDHVTLVLEKDAVLLGSTSRTDYGKNRWYALVLAFQAKNIGITGEGLIDGQGTILAQDVDRMYKEGLIGGGYKDNRPHESERPQLIDFEQCKNITIRGISLTNSACWVQRYGRCDSLVIDGIQVTSMAYWNNDGIDLVDCTNTLVQNCRINAADDGICLKSDLRDYCCNNILIRNCTIRSSASAIKFGTNSYGGFKNIVVENIEVYDTYRSALALEIVDGGALEHVECRNIRAINTGNALFLRLGYRIQRFPPGTFKDVYIHDIDVEVPAGRPDAGYPFQGPEVKEPHNLFPSSITGIPGHPIQDVRLETIKIRYAGGGDCAVACIPVDSIGKVPEQEKEYPEFSMFGELPAWGLYCRHVDGLSLKNIRLTKQAKDYRQPLIFDDVKRLEMKKVRKKAP